MLKSLSHEECKYDDAIISDVSSKCSSPSDDASSEKSLVNNILSESTPSYNNTVETSPIIAAENYKPELPII